MTGDDTLHRAVEGAQKDAMRAALTAGADINGLDKYGRTPLMVAITRAKKKALALELLKAGSLATVRGRDGLSPLDAACEQLRARWIWCRR
jgi:ankyrin repeat protein